MLHYYALVQHKAGYAFGAEFPDLPGVFSAADEEKDIISNAMEASQLYFEDRAEQEKPSSLEVLRKRPEIAQALAEGAFFVSVPFIAARHRAGA